MMIRRVLPFAFAVTLGACSTTKPSPTSAAPSSAASASTASVAPASTSSTSVVDAGDRDDADKALDAGRHPAELLAFAGIKPGMKVAELAAGGGYTAELLARAVGPTGVVYGENNKWVLEKFAEKPWSTRLQKPVMKNVVRVDREFDDPLPPEAKNLDAVFCVLFYHDFVWQKTDRKALDKHVLDALKPGGEFIIVDHAAAAGHGLDDVQTFHRIEEKTVIDEITAAGFVKDGEADFLKNASDTHDWNDSPRAAAEKRGTSDRFVLRFKKPA